jgi:hypothetical protein
MFLQLKAPPFRAGRSDRKNRRRSIEKDLMKLFAFDLAQTDKTSNVVPNM